ncbi:SRPBCC domain-containing protein [Streptomyces sp. NPDC018019]|uniref:SRPBCC domain-containing protein n=1 Tax=Streptomyces sp. NPDC018019 TaxID=3365030 RepID=UPI0037B2A049
MDHATLCREGGRAVIRFERLLPRRSPEELWRALTDHEELAAWFPSRIDTTGPEPWAAGAPLTFGFPGTGGPTLTGEVRQADRPRMLTYTWGDETLRFELSPQPDGGTRLVFTYRCSPGTAARNAAGWQVSLAKLTDGPARVPEWRPLFDGYVSAFEPVLGPQEGPPAGVGQER